MALAREGEQWGEVGRRDQPDVRTTLSKIILGGVASFSETGRDAQGQGVSDAVLM